MSAPCGPPRTRGYLRRRRAGYADPGLRVGDAERAAAADRLSTHYSDGRLDQATFDERLDEAMRAITVSDLNRLFTDLPETDAGKPAPQRRQRPQHRSRLVFLVVVAVLTAAAAHALASSALVWLVIALLALLCLRSFLRRDHRG